MHGGENFKTTLKDLLDVHINFIQFFLSPARFYFQPAGENVILNRETEIAKASWSPGIYRRALDCFQTLKLKSGGWTAAVVAFERFSLNWSLNGNADSHSVVSFLALHLQHRRHRTLHRPRPPILDHRWEIKDYRRLPRAVFIRNQLQGFRAWLPPVATRLQCTSTWVERSTRRHWKH
jgi:hypothetical protein